MLFPLALMIAAAEPATAVPSPRPSVSAPAVSMQPTLHVQKEGRHFTFTVTVHNAGSEPAELRFANSGTLQIVVTASDGSQLYDSFAGRMFAQVMKTVTIAPGKDATFSQTWDAPETISGTVSVRATVRAIPPLTVTGTIDLTRT